MIRELQLVGEARGPRQRVLSRHLDVEVDQRQRLRKVVPRKHQGKEREDPEGDPESRTPRDAAQGSTQDFGCGHDIPCRKLRLLLASQEALFDAARSDASQAWPLTPDFDHPAAHKIPEIGVGKPEASHQHRARMLA